MSTTGQTADRNPQAPPTGSLAQEFVQFAVESGVLRFGEFKTKAGRLSPYFFNAGLFDDGAKLGRLAQFYARQLLAEEQRSGLAFDMIFGPILEAAQHVGLFHRQTVNGTEIDLMIRGVPEPIGPVGS